MAQVVLIHSPVDFYDKTRVNADQTSSPPMGLLYIAAYLEKNGISVRLVDPQPEKLNLKQILNEIKKEEPLAVGISSMTPGIRAALILAKEIRKKFGKRPFIGIGGVHPSVDPTFINRYPIFDFQVVGEGEIIFCKIIRSIIAGKIPRKSNLGEIVEDLDSLPFPARHLLKGDYFCPHDAKKLKLPEATIIASRGCPFKCIFCSKPAHRNGYRFRSAQNIVDEMESVYNDCGGKYNFVDDTMGANPQKAIEFCNEIISRDLKVKFATSIRARDVSKKLLEKLAQAGCREIFIGVESGSNRIRNEIIKKYAPEKKIYEAVKLCRKLGIQSNFYLMLGFPTETKEDIKDTLEIGIKTKVDLIGIHITQIIPGSPLYDLAIKEGKISEQTVDKYILGEMGTDFFKVFPKYIPDGMTLDDLEQARKIAYRKFFINPGWIFRRVKSYFRHPDRLVRDISLIKLGIYVLIHGYTKSAPS